MPPTPTILVVPCALYRCVEALLSATNHPECMHDGELDMSGIHLRCEERHEDIKDRDRDFVGDCE